MGIRRLGVSPWTSYQYLHTSTSKPFWEWIGMLPSQPVKTSWISLRIPSNASSNSISRPCETTLLEYVGVKCLILIQTDNIIYYICILNYIYKCWHEFECQAFHFFSEKGFFIAFMPLKARTVTSSQPAHRKANRFREVSEGTISKLYMSVQGHWQRIVTMQAFVQQDFFVAASRQTQTITHQTHPNISKLILVIIILNLSSRQLWKLHQRNANVEVHLAAKPQAMPSRIQKG